jgi:arginyl-tRNA--protein-N-Asp/Glu arginylyltransferase
MEMNRYGRPNSEQELDIFLEFGWFRTGLYVFTCDFIEFDQILYRTIWLRHDLGQLTLGKTWKNLSKRNQAFRVVYSNATVTPEQEYLFRSYRRAMMFEPANNIEHLLFDGRNAELSPFNTKQVCVFHENDLIGCAYFDVGETAVAGISAFYHPDYAMYSLGIYMIYCQIVWSQQAGYRYYYPGYFIPHYTHFDYKLKIGTKALYFFDPIERKWLPIEEYFDLPLPI